MSDIDTSGAIIELTHEAQTIVHVTISQSTWIPYSMQETFEVENFRKLHSFVAILESFLQEILGCAILWRGKSEQSMKVFSQ